VFSLYSCCLSFLRINKIIFLSSSPFLHIFRPSVHRVYMCTYVYRQTHICVYTYTHMHKYIHAYIYVCIHIYIYVLVYTCICAYICMYICVDIRMYVCIRFVPFSPVASVVHVCTCSIPFQYTPGAFSHTYSFHTKRMSMGPDCTWINGDDYDICCQDCGGAIKITGYCSLSVLLTCMRYLPCQYSLLSFNSSPHILIPFVHPGA
jgi:hypothetical protein